MKNIILWKLIVAIIVVYLSSIASASTTPFEAQRAKILNKTYRMSVPFIENRGQIENKDIRFYAKTLGGTLLVEKSGVLTYNLPLEDKGGVVIKEILTSRKIKIKGLEPSPTRINYFKGKEKSKWKTNIPCYENISLGEIYKGIELTLKAYGNNVEKLFTVMPKENPDIIKINLKGAKELKINKNGELEIITKHAPVKFTKPLAYQIIGDEKKLVEVAYIIHKGLSYGFKVGNYDRKRPLIIDPLLVSTIIGTNDYDFSWTIAIDESDNMYISSSTKSPNFPTTPGAYDEIHNGNNDVFISKFDSSVSTLLASTFIGGSDEEQTYKITLDGSGNLYATGFTKSSDYPTTTGAYDETHNGNRDVFVSKLDSSLSTLLASTVIGGGDDDNGHFIALDVSDNVIITGYAKSSDYPTTTGTYDETHNGDSDIFISKFDNSVSTLLASTFIGGDGQDEATGMAFDGSGNICITGAASSNFPTTPGTYDQSHNGGTDGFVAKLNNSLVTLIASTYIGGSAVGYSYSIKVNESEEIYIAGETFSSDFPTTPGAYDESYNGSFDVFVSKLDGSLSSLLASTYLGGSEDMDWHHHSLLIDEEGNIYLNGLSKSSDFPTTPGAYKESNPTNWDCYISKFDSSLSTLLVSTFFGGNSGGDGSLGMAFDSSGNLCLTGWTRSSDFPTTPGAYDESYNADHDVFVSKFCFYGSANNYDCDNIPDHEDNCPEIANGPNLGTCVKTKAGMVVSYREGDPKEFIPCTSDADCEATGGTCQLEQGDCNSNGCGDACECLMDCNNEGAGDGKVTGSDLAVLKQEYGRFDCSELDPCYSDGNEDGKVTGADLSLLKNEYGRFDCPVCP